MTNNSKPERKLKPSDRRLMNNILMFTCVRRTLAEVAGVLPVLDKSEVPTYIDALKAELDRLAKGDPSAEVWRQCITSPKRSSTDRYAVARLGLDPEIDEEGEPRVIK